MTRWLVAWALAMPLVAGEADARRLLTVLWERHWPHGAVLDPVFASPDSSEIVSYSRCGDSAIWTGYLLAAEAFRHAVERSPDSLGGVRLALSGVERLFTVTGTGVLARCAFPADSPFAPDLLSEERHHGFYTGSIDSEPWLWIGNTSRDQYVGVFFGLSAAWLLVDDPATRDIVARFVTQAVSFLENNAWTVVMPDGSVSTTFMARADQQLSLLKLAAVVNPGRFRSSYDVLSALASPQVPAVIGAETLEIHQSYFKFNLAHATFFTLFATKNNWWNDLHYRNAYQLLRRATADHSNAFFNLVDRAVAGPNAARDAQTRAALEEWLERPLRDFPVDQRGLYPACDDQGEIACRPLPVTERVRTDFLWQRSPFQLRGGGSGRIESAGIDYLLPYWMARYYGVSN